MNLRVLKLFCWINWPINSFCTMSFCLIFRLPSQILAFIRGLPDFFVFCFNRLPSVSINFYLSFWEKNLVLPCPSLLNNNCDLIIHRIFVLSYFTFLFNVLKCLKYNLIIHCLLLFSEWKESDHEVQRLVEIGK